MPETPPPEPDTEHEPSPLSLRLASVPDEPAVAMPALSPDERDRLAKKRLNTTLKGWRLTKLLGTGPVTAAYQAYRGSKDAKEMAVIKVMVGDLATHERARGLFLRGAYAANRFNHSRVLPVMEDGADESGVAFIVRPWANALPLSEIIAGERFDEKTVLRIAEQVLDALELAHAHGIVHGAISPSNILVTERRSIRLCDFATPPGSTARSTEQDLLVQRRRGPYMAPERCGPDATVASDSSDVYSLAACMYFAVTQKAPRGDTTDASELATTPARPLREVAPGVSELFASIVDHALVLDPQHRYESAYAMLGDVRRAMAGRKPKLSDAAAPVPSQSIAELPQLTPPSSRRIPSSTAGRESLPKSGTGARNEKRRKEWRGNLMLIMAIALLVGIATFVLVREKLHDAQREGRDGDKTDKSDTTDKVAPQD